MPGLVPPAGPKPLRRGEGPGIHVSLRAWIYVDGRDKPGHDDAEISEPDHHHRSVSFSSMRRLRRKASSVLPGSIGWNSTKPAATRRCAGTPSEIRYCTTEMARADDSSQFDLNKGLLVIGRTSV